MTKPVILLILDGWGIAPPGPGNAVSQANLTHIPRLWVSYPHTELVASGLSVGLPEGEDGNTETGHINIGAGRTVYQDLPRISMAIDDKTYFKNPAFLGAIAHAKQHSSNLHLMGLLSDAGVHAKREHLYALLELIQANAPQIPVYIHVFTDGRDSPPTAGLKFVEELESRIKLIGIGKIASVMGRYFAMDRDHRWERTEAAYKVLTEQGPTSKSAAEVIQQSYTAGKTDEFIQPTIICGEDDKPLPRINNNDAVIFYNYRIDRPRQLTRAFIISNFEETSGIGSFDPYAVKYAGKHIVEETPGHKPFKRNIVLTNLFYVTMTEYERNLPATIAFPPEAVQVPLARVISDNGLRQLRISETEKERFVTYYFDGMHEDSFPGEDKIIIPSPKVPTYDLKPEMSAYEVTDKIIDRLSLGIYSFMCVNYANVDMVAHTGNIQAAIKACEIVDACVGKVVAKILALDGTCIITADHGNVEEMLKADGKVDTEHSTFPVPFIMVSHAFDGMSRMLPKGKLGDIAPTILKHMGLEIPSNMNGKNLLLQ